MYRIIDWKRNKIGIPGKVIAIEYDPNRSARIALIEYEDGERRYILAPVGMQRRRAAELWPRGRSVAGQRAGRCATSRSARSSTTSSSSQAAAARWCAAPASAPS